MIILLALIVAALVSGMLGLITGIFAYKMVSQSRRPPSFICGCQHHKSFHGEKKGCQEVIDYSRYGDPKYCGCQKYIPQTAIEYADLSELEL